MFAVQALWTAARHRVPIAVVVIDNQQYTILKSFRDLLKAGDGIPGLDLPGLDIVAAAEAFGCTAERVDTPDELEAALSRALAADGPYLLDVHVDRSIPELPGAAAAITADLAT